jgi:hypothetical protein
MRNEREPCWPSLEPSRENALSTCHLGGTGLLGSRREAAKGAHRRFEAKGPVEANKNDAAAGIDACNRNKRQPAAQKDQKATTHLGSIHHHAILVNRVPAAEEPSHLRFEARTEGVTSSWEIQYRVKGVATACQQGIAMRPSLPRQRAATRHSRAYALASQTLTF